MQRLAVVFALLLSTSMARASGWNDYVLDIGDGYTVVRTNSMDVYIRKADGRLILAPGPTDKIGPLVQYSMTQSFILAQNAGKKERNLFAGDTLQEVDRSQEFFFIIRKENDHLVGPFSAREFMERPEVVGMGAIQWTVPRNPHFVQPLLGTLLFMAIAIPILAIKFYWISIPAVIGFLLVAVRVHRRRKKVQSAASS